MRAGKLPILWCFFAAVAAHLPPGACAAIVAAPKLEPLAEHVQVIHVEAQEVVRWQEGDASLLYLRGGARIYQGTDRIVGPRLLAWFEEALEQGRSAGALEVYAETSSILRREKATTRIDQPTLFRLVSSEGITLRAQELLSGDAPVMDEFLLRALAFRRGKSPPERLAQALPRHIRPSAEEMTFTELTAEGGTMALRGNAQIISRDLSLRADAVRLRIRFREPGFQSMEIESIYAEGVVDLRREREHITAEAIYLDLRTEEGLALNARVRVYDPEREIPLQFCADVVRELSRYRFVVEGRGYFTTSKFAVPHYRIEGAEIEMVRGPGIDRLREGKKLEEKARAREPSDRRLVPRSEPLLRRVVPEAPEGLVVSSRNNIFYIESIPIFYWPYVAKDVRAGAFLIRRAQVGGSSNLGNFLKAEWNLYDLGIYFNEWNEWSELTLRTDGFSSRGLGLGLDFEYEGASRFGFARTYYIHDTADEDDRGLPTPRDDRGEVTLRHREFLPGGWRADLEIGYLSDRRFLRTYDREEFDEAKDRETRLFLSRTSSNTMLTAQAQERLNDFQNYVERYSLAYHVIGQRPFGTPLLWTSHSDLSRLELRTDRALGLADPGHLVRLDTAHELSVPIQLGPVRTDPFAWGDLTAFSEQAGDEDSVLRGAAAFGVRAATNFYRTYDARSNMFRVDRLRHFITPTAEYTNRWEVTRSPAHFVQHDEIDALDEQHRARFGIRNRLQTYRFIEGKRQPVDFVNLDVDYALHLSDTGAERGLDDYVEASARWRVTEQVHIATEDNRFNTEDGRLEELSGEIALNLWQPLRISLIHKYFLDLTEVGEPSHSISSLRVAYQPWFSRWRVEASTAYDFRARRRLGDTKDPNRLGSGLYFTRELEGWEVTVGVEFNQGRADETILAFNVSPPGGRRKSLRRGSARW